MNKLGELLGWLTAIFYGASAISFFLKAIYHRYASTIKNSLHINRPYTGLMKFAIRYHRLFGGIALVTLAAHFYIQLTTRGLNISGAFAAGLLVLQAILGAVGTYLVKVRKGLWFYLHRVTALLLFIAIIFHVLKI
ncbi:hypothetical protein KHM83_05665 [Fusibacter paucivorans]|uniref:Cytochrome b561 n=1 Tax=Fusibacter paucivorans TaxID=76009 RepID=A0ABS5PLU7_9FIRM|nr:hypothetical protein [Fusibacter paucivorans]MBS7526155.1 hypothetical protein [Fusibacter paucivorans]